jgi:uncharacterized protein (TIGR02145 family)
MKQLVILTAILMIGKGSFSQQYGSFKDSRNGKVYKTVKIGSQTWMEENLDVSTFINGDIIPEAQSNEQWKRANQNKQPAWCYYQNNSANGKKYGKLYNWYAVNDPRGIAPLGWHVPTANEWKTLTKYLGVDAATKIKNTFGWSSLKNPKQNEIECPKCSDWSEEAKMKITCNNCKGTRRISSNNKIKSLDKQTNSSGFSALPGGYRTEFGFSWSQVEIGGWWSSTTYLSFANAFWCYIHGVSIIPTFSHRSDFKSNGYYIRCMKN